MLPFTQDQFIAVFVTYNQAVGPVPLVAYVLAAAAVAAALKPRPWSGRLVAAVLALMWLWTGVAYHWMHFLAINKAAAAFGAIFVVQAGLLVYYGILRDRLRFGSDEALPRWIGLGLILYAMVLYPLLGALVGHVYPAAPTFGITPCPMTIFTFGILLLAGRSLPWPLLVVPLIWSVIGGSAAVLLAVPEDWMLMLSGIIAAGYLVRRRMMA